MFKFFAFFISLALFGLSTCQEPPSFLPPAILETLQEEVDTVVLGIGELSVTFTEENGEGSMEFGRLPWITNEEEWTFDMITHDGEAYSFVSHNGEVDLVGPNGLGINISQEYADYAEIALNEVADNFGDYVTLGVILTLAGENLANQEQHLEQEAQQ